MRARLSALLCAGLLIATAGCDNDPLQITDTLTEDEASALATALFGLTLDASLSGVGGSSDGPAAVPQQFETSFDVSGPCPLGGSLAVEVDMAGSFDPETEVGTFELDMLETHQSCVVADPETGQEYTVSGSPNLLVEVDLAVEGTAFDVTGGYGGAVDWATGTRNGTCVVELAFTGTGDTEVGAGSATISGSICGVDVSGSFSGS